MTYIMPCNANRNTCSTYIITMTINTAHASIYATVWTGPSHSTTHIKQSTLWPRSFRQVKKVIQAGQDYSTKWKDFAGRQSEMIAARSCRIQSHRSIGPLRLRPTLPTTLQGKR